MTIIAAPIPTVSSPKSRANQEPKKDSAAKLPAWNTKYAIRAMTRGVEASTAA